MRIEDMQIKPVTEIQITPTEEVGIRLKEIEDRLKAATPGLWEVGNGSEKHFMAGKNTVVAPLRVVADRATYLDGEFDKQTYADIDFIVCAHNNMPYLLTRLRAAEKDICKLIDGECPNMAEVEAELKILREDSAELALTKSRLQEAEAERDKAERDIKLIAGETNSILVCSICKWNPNDMGCELDGSQFDDNGDCHFEYRR